MLRSERRKASQGRSRLRNSAVTPKPLSIGEKRRDEARENPLNPCKVPKRKFRRPWKPNLNGALGKSTGRPLAATRRLTKRNATGSLDDSQVKQRIEAKGYSKISGLQKDSR